MNPYKTLGVDPSASPDEIKSAYRKLAAKYHPDVHRDGGKLFLPIAAAYELLSDPAKRERYDRHGSADELVVRSPSHVYRVSGAFAEGDAAILLDATNEAGEAVLLKGARDPAANDLLTNEAAALTRLHAEAKPICRRYLPELRESFVTRARGGPRRQANVLGKLEGWHTLEQVRVACPRLCFEHGVWMFNRLLEVLGYVHRLGLVHGAIVPEHVMVYASTDVDSEWDHGLKLIDWGYSGAVGSELAAYVPERHWYYPPEIFDGRRTLTPGTDIYMAAKCIAHVVGTAAPDYLQNFLRGCTLGNPAARPPDAHALLREFEQLMRDHYGPKRYVRFTLPDPN